MSVTGENLREIAKARLKTVKVLLDAEDWDGAVYMMGYVLESALKAVACKTLHLLTYPENTRNEKVDSYFMTHRFDQLLVVSGMDNIFGIRGKPDVMKNWSDFTIKFTGDWPAMRYLAPGTKWYKEIAFGLYNNLVDTKYGIITTIKKSHKW